MIPLDEEDLAATRTWVYFLHWRQVEEPLYASVV